MCASESAPNRRSENADLLEEQISTLRCKQRQLDAQVRSKDDEKRALLKHKVWWRQSLSDVWIDVLVGFLFLFPLAVGASVVFWFLRSAGFFGRWQGPSVGMILGSLLVVGVLSMAYLRWRGPRWAKRADEIIRTEVEPIDSQIAELKQKRQEISRQLDIARGRVIAIRRQLDSCPARTRGGPNGLPSCERSAENLTARIRELRSQRYEQQQLIDKIKKEKIDDNMPPYGHWCILLVGLGLLWAVTALVMWVFGWLPAHAGALKWFAGAGGLATALAFLDELRRRAQNRDVKEREIEPIRMQLARIQAEHDEMEARRGHARQELRKASSRVQSDHIASAGLADAGVSEEVLDAYRGAAALFDKSKDAMERFLTVASDAPHLFSVSVCKGLPPEHFKRIASDVAAQLHGNPSLIRAVQLCRDKKSPELLPLVALVLRYNVKIDLLRRQWAASTLLMQLTRDLVGRPAGRVSRIDGLGRCPSCHSLVDAFWPCGCGRLSCAKCVKHQKTQSQDEKIIDVPGHDKVETVRCTLGPDTLGGGWIEGKRQVVTHVPATRIRKQWQHTRQWVECPACGATLHSESSTTEAGPGRPAEGGRY
jgi:hypothetical protein